MRKQICVVGIDDLNLEKLNVLDRGKRDGYDYHCVLKTSELSNRDRYPMDELMDQAVSAIESLDTPPDAIIGFSDFPVTCITPLLAKKYNLPHLPIDVLVKCEHKYLCRLEEKKVIPDYVPDFNWVDPFSSQPYNSIEIDFPFWLKPVESFASQLGFKVHNKKEFDEYISIIQKRIHRFADPLNYILNESGLPDNMKEIDGYNCIAEQIIKGDQYTIEGYVSNGEAGYVGIFDTLRYPDQETYYSYEYPSEANEDVIKEMKHTTRMFLKSLGYDNSSFNIEYIYDDERDKIWVLEINTRISQSHFEPFYKVEGTPNHKPMVEIALGKKPELPRGEGEFNVAAKFHYRVFEDGVVTNIPDRYELDKIREEIPDMKIKIWARIGKKLSEMNDQDSYSYKLACVYLGASDKEELYNKRERCFDLLNFKIKPVN